MATTAKDLIQPALAARTANDPGKLAGTSELIRRLSSRLRLLYAEANRTNPWYFATSLNVSPSASRWARPAGSAVLRVYDTGSADPVDGRVYIVSLHDVEAELAPRIYPLGRDYYSVGRSGDPDASGDSLTFVMARLHAALDPTAAWDAAANTLEGAWPEHHNDLLITFLELYLARKDGRQADVAVLEPEYGELLAGFLEEIANDVSNPSVRNA